MSNGEAIVIKSVKVLKLDRPRFRFSFAVFFLLALDRILNLVS